METLTPKSLCHLPHTCPRCREHPVEAPRHVASSPQDNSASQRGSRSCKSCGLKRRTTAKWNARSHPPWALAQAPSLTHWGHRTPHLASVTLHFFVCVLRDNDTTLLGSVHPVFLGCRLCALLCARSGICLGQGNTSLCSKGLSALTEKICQQTFCKETVGALTRGPEDTREQGRRTASQGRSPQGVCQEVAAPELKAA